MPSIGKRETTLAIVDGENAFFYALVNLACWLWLRAILVSFASRFSISAARSQEQQQQQQRENTKPALL